MLALGVRCPFAIPRAALQTVFVVKRPFQRRASISKQVQRRARLAGSPGLLVALEVVIHDYGCC